MKVANVGGRKGVRRSVTVKLGLSEMALVLVRGC